LQKIPSPSFSTQKNLFCDKYYSLKDDVKNVEALRRGAEKAMW